MKLKEYQYRTFERGIQFEMIVCADSIKQAARLMRTTPYQIKNYGLVREPTTNEAIKEPFVRFAKIDPHGGELAQYDPNLRGKVMKYVHFSSFVNEYRQAYPTRSHLLNEEPRL